MGTIDPEQDKLVAARMLSILTQPPLRTDEYCPYLRLCRRVTNIWALPSCAETVYSDDFRALHDLQFFEFKGVYNTETGTSFISTSDPQTILDAVTRVRELERYAEQRLSVPLIFAWNRAYEASILLQAYHNLLVDIIWPSELPRTHCTALETNIPTEIARFIDIDRHNLITEVLETEAVQEWMHARNLYTLADVRAFLQLNERFRQHATIYDYWRTLYTMLQRISDNKDCNLDPDRLLLTSARSSCQTQAGSHERQAPNITPSIQEQLNIAIGGNALASSLLLLLRRGAHQQAHRPVR